MTTAIVTLGTITLGANANTITFSNIPSGYRDLYLTISGINTTTATTLRFNGDTTAGNHLWAYYSSPTPSGSTSSGTAMALQIATGASATTPGTVLVNIMDYGTTDKHKTILARHQNKDNATATDAIVGRWNSTSAITSLSLQGTTSQFGTGAVVNLYGVVS